MYQKRHIGCGIVVNMRRKGDFLFDTITDVFMSIIGFAILLICFNTMLTAFFHSRFAKKLISYTSLLIYGVFIIGALSFRNTSEDIFYIGFLLFLVIFGIMVLIIIIKNFMKEINESIEIQETEKQCRSCKYFEECDECFVKNCPYYVEAESDDYDE